MKDACFGEPIGKARKPVPALCSQLFVAQPTVSKPQSQSVHCAAMASRLSIIQQHVLASEACRSGNDKGAVEQTLEWPAVR